MDKAQIQEFLDRYGEALSAAELPAISACWTIPALVVSNTGAIAVSNTMQVESYFSQAVQWYREQGIVATRPSLEDIKVLGERLAAVEVRWDSFDESGEAKASERSFYILHRGEDGQPRIQVAQPRAALA